VARTAPDARTQRRLDAARAARRARLSGHNVTPSSALQSFRDRAEAAHDAISALMRSIRDIFEENRNEINIQIRDTILKVIAVVVVAFVFLYVILYVPLIISIPILLFALLPYLISVGVRWGNTASPRRPHR
jgi:hypothetical protein